MNHKSFDPVTQEQYQVFTCNNLNHTTKKNGLPKPSIVQVNTEKNAGSVCERGPRKSGSRHPRPKKSSSKGEPVTAAGSGALASRQTHSKQQWTAKMPWRRNGAQKQEKQIEKKRSWFSAVSRNGYRHLATVGALLQNTEPSGRNENPKQICRASNRPKQSHTKKTATATISARKPKPKPSSRTAPRATDDLSRKLAKNLSFDAKRSWVFGTRQRRTSEQAKTRRTGIWTLHCDET
jgi:hypothetical protein